MSLCCNLPVPAPARARAERWPAAEVARALPWQAERTVVRSHQAAPALAPVAPRREARLAARARAEARALPPFNPGKWRTC